MKRHFLIGALILLILSAVGSLAANAHEALYCPSFGDDIVDISLDIPATTVLAGANIPVEVTLQNISGVPISEGSLFVRLVNKSLDDAALKQAQGSVFLRAFPATDISLKDDETVKLAFDLTIPQGMPAGEYFIDSIFVPNKGFNIENPDLDIYGKSGANSAGAEIRVLNEDPKPFAYMAGTSIEKAKDGTLEVSFDLVNTSKSAVSVPVVWKEYAWNAVSDETLLGSFVEMVELDGSSSKRLSRSIGPEIRSSYTVVAEVRLNDMSVIATPVWEGEISEPVTSSLGISTVEGSDSLLAYGCVKNFMPKERADMLVFTVNGESSSFNIGNNVTFQFSKDVLRKDSRYDVKVDIYSKEGELLSSSQKTLSCGLVGGCKQGVVEKFGEELLTMLTVLAAGIGGLITILHYKRRRMNRVNA
jgi:hypothetical protein